MILAIVHPNNSEIKSQNLWYTGDDKRTKEIIALVQKQTLDNEYCGPYSSVIVIQQ